MFRKCLHCSLHCLGQSVCLSGPLWERRAPTLWERVCVLCLYVALSTRSCWCCWRTYSRGAHVWREFCLFVVFMFISFAPKWKILLLPWLKSNLKPCWIPQDHSLDVDFYANSNSQSIAAKLSLHLQLHEQWPQSSIHLPFEGSISRHFQR